MLLGSQVSLRCDSWAVKELSETPCSSKRLLATESVQLNTGVGCWMICSVAMLVSNQLAIKAFPVPCSLVAIQFAFAMMVMVAGCWRYLYIGSMRDVLCWCRVVPFFTGMILTSILALQHAPMTLVITIRALSPVFTLMAEFFFPKPLRVSPAMCLSLAAIIIGVVIYVYGMENSSYIGTGWAVLNTFLVVADRLLQRLMLARDQKPVDMSKTAATLLNNLLGIGPLLVAASCTGEFEQVESAVTRLDAVDVLWIVTSCVAGVGISYCGIVAQSFISATSFLVLVNANKFAIVVLEVFVFRTKALKPHQVLGAIITIMASIAYGWARETTDQLGDNPGDKLELMDMSTREECGAVNSPTDSTSHLLVDE
mmetsp:Transcript_49630/g.106315  ORF Transcript_49630/g.106315 Transcript_49630/m.106315 type:complete len:369 (+) Transcript_49630:126-1232(+)